MARNLADEADGPRITVEPPWQPIPPPDANNLAPPREPAKKEATPAPRREPNFQDASSTATQVGMLPPGIGVRGRVSWLSNRLSSRGAMWIRARARRLFAVALIAGMAIAAAIFVGPEKLAASARSGLAFVQSKISRPSGAPAKTLVAAKSTAPRTKPRAVAKPAGNPARAASASVAGTEWVVPAASTGGAAPARTTDTDRIAAGHVLMRAGMFAEAEAAYRNVTKDGDPTGEARYWLAVAEWRQGKTWRACRHLRKYIADFPQGIRVGDAQASVDAECD